MKEIQERLQKEAAAFGMMNAGQRDLCREAATQLQALEERVKELQATIRRMDAANIKALEDVGAWDDPSGFNGVVSNIGRLGARTQTAEQRVEQLEGAIQSMLAQPHEPPIVSDWRRQFELLRNIAKAVTTPDTDSDHISQLESLAKEFEKRAVSCRDLQARAAGHDVSLPHTIWRLIGKRLAYEHAAQSIRDLIGAEDE